MKRCVFYALGFISDEELASEEFLDDILDRALERAALSEAESSEGENPVSEFSTESLAQHLVRQFKSGKPPTFYKPPLPAGPVIGILRGAH